MDRNKMIDFKRDEAVHITNAARAEDGDRDNSSTAAAASVSGTSITALPQQHHPMDTEMPNSVSGVACSDFPSEDDWMSSLHASWNSTSTSWILPLTDDSARLHHHPHSSNLHHLKSLQHCDHAAIALSASSSPTFIRSANSAPTPDDHVASNATTATASSSSSTESIALHCVRWFPQRRNGLLAILFAVSAVGGSLIFFKHADFVDPLSISFSMAGLDRQQKPTDDVINGPPVSLQVGETVVSRRDQARHTTVSDELHSQRHASTLDEHVSQSTTATTTTTTTTAALASTSMDDANDKAAASTASQYYVYAVPRHAADALVCRESVINFVINATDGKDECDGLIRAFDKTCSNNRDDDDNTINDDGDGAASLGIHSDGADGVVFDDQKEQQQQQKQQKQPRRSKRKSNSNNSGGTTREDMLDRAAAAVAAGRSHGDHGAVIHSSSSSSRSRGHHNRNHNNGGGRRPRQRRLMWDKTRRSRQWKVWAFEASQWIHQVARYIWNGGKPFFFAEDEIESESAAWKSAQYLVQSNLDQTVFPETRRAMQQRAYRLAQIDRQQEQQNNTRHNNQRGRHLQDSDTLSPVQVSSNNGGSTATTTTSSSFFAAAGNMMSSSALGVTGGASGLSTKNLTIPKPPLPKLNVPTKSLHASDTLFGDAYLLQGNLVERATNSSTASHNKEFALEDAKASSKAIHDTSNAVSAVLNDPSSIEARTCCASILNVYHENCNIDDEEEISDTRLFLVVLVMALCGMVKSLIRHFKILWLPEAAGCILVGVVSGYGLMYFPHSDISFDGNWFLRIMVPPIIFEAALSIDKKAFNRHVVPILIFAIGGTLLATIMTAFIVHRGTAMLRGLCTTIPYVEALTFGALISSIDPIAVLSVLSNMGMTDTDTIYVLIFGESLLNDGVAIVLFQTLVHFLDEKLVIDSEAITAAAFHFFIVAFGSLLVGIASGMLSTVYYWLFHGCQTPLVEVLMFFCWALLPYYVCDGVGWSGIVSAVATGFVMDLHIVGQQQRVDSDSEEDIMERSDHPQYSILNNNNNNNNGSTSHSVQFSPVISSSKRGYKRRIFSPDGHLSEEAKTHIGFVMEIISTVMETAIFAYLGLFLFSHRYHWNVWHALIAIVACCVSRAMMISSLSLLANWITRLRTWRIPHMHNRWNGGSSSHVVIDKKMQMALWIAGLRGAMSFALVEHIPLYDAVSGEGTRLKPELKAMTSASIMFTVFILGGSTYYAMQSMGIAPTGVNTGPVAGARKMSRSGELISLLRGSNRSVSIGSSEHHDEDDSNGSAMEPTSSHHGATNTKNATTGTTTKNTTFRRQRAANTSEPVDVY